METDLANVKGVIIVNQNTKALYGFGGRADIKTPSFVTFG